MAVEDGRRCDGLNKIKQIIIGLLISGLWGCQIAPGSTPFPLTATAMPSPMLPPTLTPSVTPSPEIPLPPSGMLYHGVYTAGTSGEEDDLTLEDLRSYEQTVGKTAVWFYFSNNWYRSREFPLATASLIRDSGSIPFIRIMLRSSLDVGTAEPNFNLQNILNGRFDSDFHRWCASARDFATPLLAEYGTEVNGEWFSWNGIWNGAGETDGYGNPGQPDGPERFRDAYRHIIQICREESAENITWVFHVNNEDSPKSDWNRLENYYPGDEWIDWIAISLYGAQSPQDDYWDPFRPSMDQIYSRLTQLTPSKPIILAEFGTTKNNPLGDQAQWTREALTDITSFRYPRLIGFAWWNSHWQNDDNPKHDTTMRVQDNPELAEVFQELVGNNPNVLGKVIH